MTANLKKNLLMERLVADKSIIGTWCSSSSANVVSTLASTHLDFVIIDMEHGSMGYETAENMVRAAEAGEIAPIIRTSTDDPQELLRVLETGVRSIMVPHVDSAAKAKRVASACRYKPDGDRGLSPYTRIHGYSHVQIEDSLISENEVTCVGVLVEGSEGLKNLKEIVEVSGIDFVYLGLFDICQSVGLPGQVNHPDVLAEVDRCSKVIRRAGKIAGCMATDAAFIVRLKELEYKFIAYLNDSAAIKNHFEHVIKHLNT